MRVTLHGGDHAELWGYLQVRSSPDLAPTGTLPAIVAKLHAETVKALQLPEVRQTLAQQGAEVGANTPAQFSDLIRHDIVRWAKVVKAAGVKPN